jgi:hypothetical protein
MDMEGMKRQGIRAEDMALHLAFIMEFIFKKVGV